MKKTFAIIFVSLLAFSTMTACGSKSDNANRETSSRVLYSDNDTAEQETKKITASVVSSKSDSDTDAGSKNSSDADSKKKDSKNKTAVSNMTVSSGAESVSSSSVSVSSNNNSSVSVSSAVSTEINSNDNDNVTSENTEEDKSNDNNGESSSEPQTDGTVSEEVSDETDTMFDEISDTENTFADELNQDDFKAAINGTEIKLEDNIEDVVATLGEPIDIIKAPSCKYAGLEDKTYIYDGFTINTYPNFDGSLDYVAGIEITIESFETSRKIKIGSSVEEMLAAYGENFATVGNTYRYILEDRILSFYAEGDVIREISFILNN